MPTSNVEIVTRSYEAAERALRQVKAYFPGDPEEGYRVGDLPLVSAYLEEFVDPDVEWQPLWTSEPYRGHAGVVRYGREFNEILDDWRWENHKFEAVGDAVLGVFTVFVTGRGTRIPVEQRIAITYTLKNGRINSYREYPSRDAALATL